MDDRQLNHLKTGALFVVPGQIMDPGIMKLPRYPNERSRLSADVGLDVLEAEVAPAAQRSWSYRWLARLSRRPRRPALAFPLAESRWRHASMP